MTHKKIKYPPRVDTEGFDKEALRKVALTKIEELKVESKTRELGAKVKENFAYWVLTNVKKYCGVWFSAQIYLYSLENFRDNFRLWLKYWERIGGLYTPRSWSKNGFTDNELERARSYPIEKLIGEFRKVGSRITTKCPFHNPTGDREKSRSFFIFKDNSYHCFSCNAHGKNCLDYLMQKEQLDFKEAVRRLL